MTPQVSVHLNTDYYTSFELKRKMWELLQREGGSNKSQSIQKKLKEKEKKEWKATQISIKKCAQIFSWLMRGTSIDKCSLELQPKINQKQNKTKALLCKFENLQIVQNVSFKWKFA